MGGSAVMMPGRKAHASAYALRRHKSCCKRRSAIEAIIGHLKSDHRMGRNYLKGSIGDSNNALLAGMGFNLLLLVRELAGNFLAFMFWAIFSLIPSRKLRFARNDAPSCERFLRLDYSRGIPFNDGP